MKRADRRTYVVTGGAGFIGSNVVAALDERGDDVIIVDRLGRSEKWRNIVTRRLVDLIQPEGMLKALDELPAPPAAIIHMGAVSSTTEKDADLIVERNFRFSCSLWGWCATKAVPLVYASSASTYGDGSRGFDDDGDPAYLAGLRPLNAYGWSKHLFDRWACDRALRGDPSPPRWHGLKFFNVFGPNEFHKGSQQSVAVQIFRQLHSGQPARLFRSYRSDIADGGQTRDFVWVGDCVDALLWLVDGASRSGLYNVGTGHARSFNDLARAVATAMDTRLRIEYIEMPDALRGSFQYETQAKMSKLTAAGYSRSALTLEEGARRYVQDFLFRSNPYR